MTDWDKLVESCPYETKLAVTQWVMKHIAEHAIEGGSYRYLIYSRLGFNSDAYGPLLDSGMFISNEFDISQMDTIKQKVKEHKIDILKADLGMCDEPGCYKEAECGFSSDESTFNGYRRTCYDHYNDNSGS